MWETTPVTSRMTAPWLGVLKLPEKLSWCILRARWSNCHLLRANSETSEDTHWNCLVGLYRVIIEVLTLFQTKSTARFYVLSLELSSKIHTRIPTSRPKWVKCRHILITPSPRHAPPRPGAVQLPWGSTSTPESTASVFLLYDLPSVWLQQK